ncbi:hypothetical protein F441_09885, partial [Phytophthora nicotianae CJ01A1]
TRRQRSPSGQQEGGRLGTRRHREGDLVLRGERTCTAAGESSNEQALQSFLFFLPTHGGAPLGLAAAPARYARRPMAALVEAFSQSPRFMRRRAFFHGSLAGRPVDVEAAYKVSVI